MRQVRVDLALGRSEKAMQDARGEVVTSGPLILVRDRIPYLTDDQKQDISKHVAKAAATLCCSSPTCTDPMAMPRKELVLAALDKVKAK